MFGMEAARLFVSVGVDGMDQLTTNMKRTEALVNEVGNSKASVLINAETGAANNALDNFKAKYVALGGSAKTFDLVINTNPALRAIGLVKERLDGLKTNIVLHAQGGGLGTFAQDLASGSGLRGALSGVMSKVGGGMAQGGFGGGLQAGAMALGPIGIAAGAAAAIGGFGLMKAGEQERFQTQLAVLLGGVDKAKARIADLTQFAATTPFELPEVVNASKTLQVFAGDALSSGKALRLIGDVASGTGSNFGETAMWFGRMYDAMKSGRPFGEATMRLQEMGAMGGASRAKIEELAAKVKDGSLTMEQAWAGAEGEFGRFSGMMDKQSMTLEGKMSNLSDAFGQAGMKLGIILLPAAKAIVDVLILVITTVGNLFEGLGNLIGVVVDVAKGFADWITQLPEVANAIKGLNMVLGFAGDAFSEWKKSVDDTLHNAGLSWDMLTGKTAAATAAQAAQADMLSSSWYKSFREGERNIQGPAKAIADTLPRYMTQAAKDTVVITHQTVLDIANALRDKRSAWQKAVDGLKYDLEHSMSTAAEIAAIKGELAAVNASKGWKSGDPVLITTLSETKGILEARLAELTPVSKKAGKEAMDQMGAILKANQTPANAARLQAEAVAAKLAKMPGYEWGSTLIQNWINGMHAKEGAVVRQALLISGKVANIMKLQSPAKEGPLSEGGGPEGWGARGIELYAAGWASGMGKMTALANRLPGMAHRDAPSGAAGSRGITTGLGGGSGLHVEIHHIDARGSTDPAATKRAVHVGVMDAVVEGLRQQNARLPMAVSS